MKKILFVVTLFFGSVLYAQNISIICSSQSKIHTHHKHQNFELCFTENNCPEYVIWTLTKKQVELAQQHNERKDNFKPCELGSADLIDYKGSGFDRGHIVPYADMDFNEVAGNETFLMCNMCPQEHKFNAGTWAELEKLDRTYAKMKSKIEIAAGPIFDENSNIYIGKKNKVRVPFSYWRIYFNQQTNFLECYMVDVGQDTARKVKLSEIEQKTGLKIKVNRSLQKGAKIAASNVAPDVKGTSKGVATAASRASEAKEDLDWVED